MQDYGLRPDGTKKGRGWLGPLRSPSGHVVSEYTIGVPIGGREMDIPTLVPTLTRREIAQVIHAADNDQDVPDSVKRKAIAHAEMMIGLNRSVFAPNGWNPSLSWGIPNNAAYFQDIAKGVR